MELGTEARVALLDGFALRLPPGLRDHRRRRPAARGAAPRRLPEPVPPPLRGPPSPASCGPRSRRTTRTAACAPRSGGCRRWRQASCRSPAAPCRWRGRSASTSGSSPSGPSGCSTRGRRPTRRRSRTWDCAASCCRAGTTTGCCSSGSGCGSCACTPWRRWPRSSRTRGGTGRPSGGLRRRRRRAAAGERPPRGRARAPRRGQPRRGRPGLRRVPDHARRGARCRAVVPDGPAHQRPAPAPDAGRRAGAVGRDDGALTLP